MTSNKGVIFLSGETSDPLYVRKRLYMLEYADKKGIDIVKTYRIPADADDTDSSYLESAIEELRKHNKNYGESEQIRYFVIPRYSDLESYGGLDILLDVIGEIGLIIKAVY